MNRRLLPVAGVLAVVVAVVVGLVWRPWASAVPEDAAFVVGEREVGISELDQRNDSLRALYGVQEPSGKAGRAEFRRQAAKSMVISIVLERAADDASIAVPAEEVDAALRTFLDNEFDGDRKAFIDALGNVGTSEAEVREEIERQMRLRLLLDHVAGDVKVSDEDLRAAFTERKEELATPERRAVSNIVVSTRRDAADVRRRLDAGADIATLARQVSMDAATRDKGGRLGKVARADLVPSVGKAVFGAAPGKAYGPVEGPQGWNAGVVTDVEPRVPARFVRVVERLRATLEHEERTRRWSAWLEERLRSAEIEYADEYRPEDPFEVTPLAGSMDTAPEGESP